MTSARQARAITISSRLLLLLLLCTAAWLALDRGLRLRRWAWLETDPIHYYPDMNNGIHWGSQGNEPAASPRGFLDVYDLVATSSGKRVDDSREYGLDYAPLRLLLITRWEAWAAQKYPEVIRASIQSESRFRTVAWHPPYEFYGPLLRFNDATEIAGVIGLFLLTRHWVLRGDRRWGSASRSGMLGAIYRPFRGTFAGGLAAILFWLNPAVILSSHGWPTWDEWIIPFFVWTVYLCCIDWWFTAGVVLAIGAMFKGQQLFVAPMFILWPIFIGRPMLALRWTAGLAIGTALIASPWLLTSVPGGVTATTSAVDRRVDLPAVGLVHFTAMLVGLPPAWIAWRKHRASHEIQLQDQLPKQLPALLHWIVSWIRIAYLPLAVLTFAIAILLCPLWFHGSLNWLYIGWGYGTRHYMHMVQGVSDNLAGLMQERYGWNDLSTPVFTFAAHPIRLWPTRTTIFVDPMTMTIRAFLVSLYVFFFTICVIGMAIHYRRNDPRFLVALTAVWLMFFTLMPQIHERYLLYAAGVGCALTAVGFGFVLLDLFLTVLTFVMTIHVMLNTAVGDGQLLRFATDVSPTFSRTLYRVISRTYPDASWALLLCAGIFIYHSLAPSRKPRRSL
jgi:hypothetical protein